MKIIKKIFSKIDIIIICLFTLFYGIYIPIVIMTENFNLWSIGGSLALILLNIVLIYPYRNTFRGIIKYFKNKGAENS